MNGIDIARIASRYVWFMMSYHPNRLMVRKLVRMKISPGTIMVAMIRAKTMSLPLKFRRAKAKAARIVVVEVPIVVMIEITIVFFI